MSGRLGMTVVAGAVASLVVAGWLGPGLLAPKPIPPAPAPASAPPPRLPPTLDGTGTVRVRVVSAKDQKPLAGVTVVLLREMGRVDPRAPLESALTDGEGIAVFSSAPAGAFNICARGARHSEFCEEDVGLVAGGTVSSTLTLPPGASIRGQLRLPDGSPAVGVRLMAVADIAVWPEPRMPTEAVTDVLGNYHLDGVTPGWSNLYLFAPVAFPFHSEGRYTNRLVEVVGGMDLQFDIQLQEFVHVSVKPHLRHIRGGALAPQISEVSMRTHWGSTDLTLGENGDWTGRVEAGVHVLKLLAWSGESPVSVERTVEVRSGSPVVIPVNHVTSVKKRREERGWFEGSLDDSTFEFAGHIFLPDGTPARGARVAVRGAGTQAPCGNGPFWHRYVRFEGSGFAVKVFTFQRFAYAWTDDGYAGSVSLSGKAGERVVADIHLEAAGAVRGRLAFLPSSEFMDVPYFGFGDGDFHELRHIAQDGRFVVAGIKPGGHEMHMRERSETYRFDVQAGVATDVGELWPTP